MCTALKDAFNADRLTKNAKKSGCQRQLRSRSCFFALSGRSKIPSEDGPAPWGTNRFLRIFLLSRFLKKYSASLVPFTCTFTNISWRYTVFVQGQDLGNLDGMERIRGWWPVCLFVVTYPCTESKPICSSFKKSATSPWKRFIVSKFAMNGNTRMIKFSMDLMNFCITSAFWERHCFFQNPLACSSGVSLILEGHHAKMQWWAAHVFVKEMLHVPNTNIKCIQRFFVVLPGFEQSGSFSRLHLFFPRCLGERTEGQIRDPEGSQPHHAGLLERSIFTALGYTQKHPEVELQRILSHFWPLQGNHGMTCCREMLRSVLIGNGVKHSSLENTDWTLHISGQRRRASRSCTTGTCQTGCQT